MNCLETLRCETCQEQSMAKIVENGGSSIAISVEKRKKFLDGIRCIAKPSFRAKNIQLHFGIVDKMFNFS